LFAAAVFFCWIESDYEDRLYDAFVAEALRPGMSELERVVALMEQTHEVVGRRGHAVVSADAERFRGLKRAWLHSGDLELLEGNNDCGSYATVFVEACHRAGIPARVCQLRTGGQSIHILAEAFVDGRWVAVDPLFGQLFYDRQGQPSGLREVIADWAFFKGQSPPSYSNLGHEPEGVLYTSWARLPLLGQAVRGILSVIGGTEYAETFSLRSHFLNTYRTYLILALLGMVGYNLTRLALARRQRRRQRVRIRHRTRLVSAPAIPQQPPVRPAS